MNERIKFSKIADYLRLIYVDNELNMKRIDKAESTLDKDMLIRLLEEVRRKTNRYVRFLKGTEEL